MIRSALSLSGETHPARYPLIGLFLVLAQHAYVWAAFRLEGSALHADAMFWLFPMRSLMELLDSNSLIVAGGFTWCLICSLLLAIASFRRANWSKGGHAGALFAMVPTIQIGLIAILSFVPRFAPNPDMPERPGFDVAQARRQTLIGLASGMTIIVLAVLVSANALGAYGDGLFVATPLLVGFTTGYAVNLNQQRSASNTVGLVIFAGLLGTLALLMLALEGLMCIILIAPLAAGIAAVGGLIGRAMAVSIHYPRKPLLSLSILPLLFLLDAAMPPEAALTAQETIIIAAPPAAIWRALTADHVIARPPGPVGIAGLAYPVSSQFLGKGIGTQRIGRFSTGQARETVTAWHPGRLLAFSGDNHAPAMEEMSPYRRVHAPHVDGYFDTLDTRFSLTPLANGTTQVTLQSRHILRIDPVPYWGPIAKWAIRQNMRRVLDDLGARSAGASIATGRPSQRKKLAHTKG